MIRPCGPTRLLIDLAIHIITNRGTTPHCSVILDECWSSSTLNRSNILCLHVKVMSCKPRPVTLCLHLADLNSMFTYSFLVTPAQTQILTVDTILYYVSQHINNTWGFYLEPSSMDLRWSDCTGDTLALRNHQLLIDLLREQRPYWTEGQEFGILNTIRDFDNPSQPYIMRMSCHQALPNPNMLPWINFMENGPTGSVQLAVSISVLFSCSFFLVLMFSFISFWLKSRSWPNGIPHLPI